MKKKLMAIIMAAVVLGGCLTASANSFFVEENVYQKVLQCYGVHNAYPYYYVEGSSKLVAGSPFSPEVVFVGCAIRILSYDGADPLDSLWEEGVSLADIDPVNYNPNIANQFEFYHFYKLYGDNDWTEQYSQFI